MWMIFTHCITDDTGGFTERTVIVITVFIHGINNAAVYRFQAVADIRQRARITLIGWRCDVGAQAAAPGAESGEKAIKRGESR